MLTRRLFPFCILALAASCSSTAEPESPQPIAETEFRSTYAQAFCDVLQTCCMTASAPFNRTTCLTKMEQEAETHVSIRGESSVYDGNRARQCVDKVRSLYAPCLESPAVVAELTAACRLVRVGTIAPGGVCRAREDCAPSEQGPTSCAIPVASSIGECVVERPGAADELCRGSGAIDPNVPPASYHATCGAGLYCAPSNRCTPKLSEGATCVSTPSCPETMWCRPPNLTDPPPLESRCRARLAADATCNFADECTSETCFEGKCARGKPVAPGRCFQ